MTTPKMLSFLASAAAIEPGRATSLWQEAAAHAGRITGEQKSLRHTVIAHRRMIALVETDILDRHSAGAVPWLTLQAHIGIVPMFALETLSRATSMLREMACGAKGLAEQCGCLCVCQQGAGG